MPFISDALRERISHAGYYVGSALASKYPSRALIEGMAHAFDLPGFAAGGQCAIELNREEYAQLMTTWTGDGLVQAPENAMYDVDWNGESLTVLLMTFAPGTTTYYWISAASKEIAERFFEAVRRWCAEIRSEILVFAGGQFYKDEALYREIKTSSLDKIILRDEMKNEIVDDLSQFFDAKSMYDEYSIPWKRGVLFLGPPGNGKTLTVKALISALGRPCIYVKSFDLPMMNAYPQAGINAVFARARQSTPCLLVLEDLDALIGDHNRSFFLNELDGFASNAGIVTIATSNHPERLDPSILERPSRFDRKYHFELPDAPQRSAYVDIWNKTLVTKLTLDSDALQRLVDKTEGFSFAYIKEVYLSSMMRWASGSRSEPFHDIVLTQVDALRAQMSTSNTESSSSPSAGNPPFPPQMLQMMAMHGFGRPFGVAYPSQSTTVIAEADQDSE